MSKADKMFEELGFIKKEMLPRLVYYTSGDMEVGIDLLDKRYWHTNGDSICHRAHLAIHEKMKELGWIDEQD